MSNLIDSAYSADEFRKQGHELIDILAGYLEQQATNPNEKALNWQNPDQLLDKWNNYLQSEPNFSDASLFNNMLHDSIHIHNPKFIGHQVCAPLPHAALSELVTAFTNNSSALFEMSPVGTVMEKIVVDQMCKAFGYGKQAFGLITSGGSIGNLTALLAARQVISENKFWEQGTIQGAQLAIMVADTAHYSIERAIKIMGWGNMGLIKVPVTNDFKINPEYFEPLYMDALDKGIKVIALVLNTCSTATGTYDPIDEAADFCAKYRIWLHADATHGGAAIFSDTHRLFLKGIEKADSIVIDFHKMMMIPALATAVLFKNGNHAYASFAQKADYLWTEQTEPEWFNPAKRSLECTKFAIGIKVFGIFKKYGTQLFSDFVDTTYQQAANFAQTITQTPHFELLKQPESNIICFRFNNGNLPSDSEISELNAAIRLHLTQEGLFYIVQTGVNNATWLRLTVMNVYTTNEHITQLLHKITGLAAQIMSGKKTK